MPKKDSGLPCEKCGGPSITSNSKALRGQPIRRSWHTCKVCGYHWSIDKGRCATKPAAKEEFCDPVFGKFDGLDDMRKLGLCE